MANEDGGGIPRWFPKVGIYVLGGLGVLAALERIEDNSLLLFVVILIGIATGALLVWHERRQAPKE